MLHLPGILVAQELIAYCFFDAFDIDRTIALTELRANRMDIERDSVGSMHQFFQDCLLVFWRDIDPFIREQCGCKMDRIGMIEGSDLDEWHVVDRLASEFILLEVIYDVVQAYGTGIDHSQVRILLTNQSQGIEQSESLCSRFVALAERSDLLEHVREFVEDQQNFLVLLMLTESFESFCEHVLPRYFAHDRELKDTADVRSAGRVTKIIQPFFHLACCRQKRQGAVDD